MGLYFIEDPDGCWLEILPNKAEFAPQSGVDVLDAMARRRSVRRYSGESVPQALPATRGSASGRSRRPWELIVVRDRAMLDDLAECREQGTGMLTGADAAIVVVADPTLADTWVEDCSIVMANMQLEAAASGVGSCRVPGAAADSGPFAPSGRWTISPRVRREPPEGASPLSAGGHPLSWHARSRSPAPPLRRSAAGEGAQGDVLEIQFHSLPCQDRRFGTAAERGGGEIGDLVPREEKILAKSRDLVPFRGKIRGLVPALGRISRFGTREGRSRASRPGVSPGPGNQIAEVDRNRDTKPRLSPKFGLKTDHGVPNLKFCQRRSLRPKRSTSTRKPK